ncbi:hypothetical protein R3W88_001173 [Solanum pinnatisectum]|uniref:Uncharacterized protein n=1 Tax=Solanum pinnatisectum TaxID=50273 RepID=A0AAV9MI93_9SOLN|nr:hypothetical protein R3W88_001173 [Solanum pinnatisectum]
MCILGRQWNSHDMSYLCGSPIGSPPLVVDGGKNNKGPILLSDDKEFERTLKLIGGTSFKIFIILRM